MYQIKLTEHKYFSIVNKLNFKCCLINKNCKIKNYPSI